MRRHRGEAGGTVRRYSDVLLIVLLKSVLPDRYRDRVEGRGVLANIDLAQVPDALVARIAAGEDPRSVLAIGSGASAVAKGNGTERDTSATERDG